VLWFGHGWEQRHKRSLYGSSSYWDGEENGKKKAKNWWVRIRAV